MSLFAVVWVCTVPIWFENTVFGLAINRLWQRHTKFLTVFSLAVASCGLAFACHERLWELRIPAVPSSGISPGRVFPVGAVQYLRERGFRGN